jgi:hypothetical protein
MWHAGNVESLSTSKIVGRLERIGIETSGESFRALAREHHSTEAICEEWIHRPEYVGQGYDEDFALCASIVLWDRWTPEEPYAEGVHEFLEEGREARDQGDLEAACEAWSTAWEWVQTVTPVDVDSLEAAQSELAMVFDLDGTLRDFESALAELATEDPTYHERRVELARSVRERFPDASEELLADLREARAGSRAALEAA